MKEESFGIIPVRQVGNQWQLLLIQHKAGHWAFPKGHPEEGESGTETATRELQEETNLTVVSYLEAEPLTEQYTFMRKSQKVAKSVTYYPAIVQGALKVAENEIIAARWLSLNEAKELATFPECKKLIDQFLRVVNLSL